MAFFTDRAALTDKDEFCVDDLKVSADHCQHVIACEQAPASKLIAGLSYVKEDDSPGQDCPVVKALQANANGIALIATGTMVLEARQDDIKLEQTLEKLVSEQNKLDDKTEPSDLLKIAKDISSPAGDATKLSKSHQRQ